MFVFVRTEWTVGGLHFTGSDLTNSATFTHRSYDINNT